ncbi:biotin synthase BioB [Flavobacteriaceae bacterium]|nr:biotin synthase BioB [Flavobacteriaceae bacterium]
MISNINKIPTKQPEISSKIRNNWQLSEVEALLETNFMDLIFEAAKIHRQYHDANKIQTSNLLSIKTGSCPEDCKYCPQSAHHNTGLKKEPFMEVSKVVDAARKARSSGATRFCMGAAWRNLNDRDLDKVCDMVAEVKNLGLETCVTLGMVNQKQSKKLKDAGLDYYNHNIDSSPEYYKEIISTRTFDDRLKTLESIRESGLKTCSGGIVGMGESPQDRAKMLITLANLPEHPQSVPINKLVKVKGTPLENVPSIDNFDFIKIIATARIMMPKSFVRLSAGREEMNEEMQALCFLAGANSIFYGDKLLTTANPEHEADNVLFKKLGIN